MSAREVVGIGVDLCRALSALQAASLLHRDIKAHNVMREVGGRIVLMDFSGAWTSEPRRRTRERVRHAVVHGAGALRRSRPPSVASDIYSLACLLFYLLSGRVPVEGATVASSRTRTREARAMRLRDLRPELPEAVVQVVEAPRAARRARPLSDRRRAGARARRHVRRARGAAVESVDATCIGRARRTSPADLKTPVMCRSTGGAAVAIGALHAGNVAPIEPALDPMMVRFPIGLPRQHRRVGRAFRPMAGWSSTASTVDGRTGAVGRELDAVDGRPIPHHVRERLPFWSPGFSLPGVLRQGEAEED